MPQHSYEYCNNVRWFFDNFHHPHRAKLLFVAAAFVTRAAHHQRHMPDYGPAGRSRRPRRRPGCPRRRCWNGWTRRSTALRPTTPSTGPRPISPTASIARRSLKVLAVASAKIGNDPHNQELGLCPLEDYGHRTAAERDRLLLASAKHTAGHRKYGSHLDAWRRYAEAFGLARA